MSWQPSARSRDDLSSFGTTNRKTRAVTYSQQTLHGTADGFVRVHWVPRGRLRSSPWSRLLSIVFATVAAAYFLVICFHLIRAGRRSASSTRFLAGHREVSCDWDSGPRETDPVDNDTGDDRTPEETLGQSAQEPSEEGVARPSQQFQGFRSLANMGHEEETDAEETTAEKASRTSLGLWSQEREMYKDHQWGERNLPGPVKQRLLIMLSRMVRASGLCRSLLPMLTCTQRLQLTYLVMRLIALDLGAISLVREDIEPARQSVGDSLISLGLECVGSSGSEAEHEGQRASLRGLMGLVHKLKERRHIVNEYNARKYRKKMLSIMGTAGLILKNCLGVLEGLLHSNYAKPSLPLPEAVVKQQFNVLKALYRVHAEHIAKDGPLCGHILKCQEQTGMHTLIGCHNQDMFEVAIPKLRDLQKQIKEAVRSAGGLLPLQHPVALGHPSASSVFGRDSEPTNINPEAPHGTLGQQMLHERSAEDTGQVFDSAAFSSSKSMHGGTSLPPAAVPQWSASQPSHQGAEPAAQPLPQLESRPLDHQPQWVMSKTLEQSPGSWTSWLHAAHQPFHSPERHQPQEPSFPARSVDRVAPQFAPGGFSVGPIEWLAATGRDIGPLLTPTTQLAQRTPVESSARLHSSAAGPHTGEYSLFGQGGVPPWLPVSKASASSFDTPDTAGHGLSGGQEKKDA
ncbi:hypothetical protein ETH_00018600 [Eimeria tenella]|uniref:Uncharacterized protein n=1 Tax=Eimeria tenella TaxID=5802 RepID=U6KWY4_EIMTE|nr:hypothetical protein ETH_00018600 [Eimeria tenella]CDJ42461.1 hypothetical protein ETH_00018600 [Eimeria tenella]|eukprot:XP_013233211.1 hypothetical protein ETH_00018600 [Eimeria tenella]